MLFDGQDYLVWERRTHDALALQGLLDVALNSEPQFTIEKERQDDRKARALITSTLSDRVLQSIPFLANSDASSLLEHLARTYTQPSRIIALAEFKELRCKQTNNEGKAAQLKAMHDYLVSMSALWTEAGGEKAISDDMYCRSALAGLGREHKDLRAIVAMRAAVEYNGIDPHLLHDLILETLASLPSTE